MARTSTTTPLLRSRRTGASRQGRPRARPGQVRVAAHLLPVGGRRRLCLGILARPVVGMGGAGEGVGRAQVAPGRTAAGAAAGVVGQHPLVVVLRDRPGAALAQLAQDFAQALQREGVYVAGFFYPVVPLGQARIRSQMSAAHTPQQIQFAVEAFIRVGKRLGVII